MHHVLFNLILCDTFLEKINSSGTINFPSCFYVKEYWLWQESWNIFVGIKRVLEGSSWWLDALLKSWLDKKSGQVLDCPATPGCTSMRWQTDLCCSGRLSVEVKPLEIEGHTVYLHPLKVQPAGAREVPQERACTLAGLTSWGRRCWGTASGTL